VDCLIINSYAGSLVLGAKAAGIPIRRSMEDSGYGIDGQRLNWPELSYVPKTPWPKDDLTNTIVIAHPPCSAFSNMNLTKEKRGTSTDAFDCHRRVLDYALSQQCHSLAIESVTGALAAAGEEYATFADRYGYGHCFVLLNAVSFGVPQWRPRFWALFFREKRESYTFGFSPRYVPLQSTLNGEEATDTPTVKHGRYMERKFAAAGFNYQEMMKGDYQGGFDKIARAYLRDQGKEAEGEAVKVLTGTMGMYRAGLPRKLDPTLWAPVILGFSYWCVHDRALNRVEYQRIMGFPDDYRWNVKMEKDFLTYLSKGVCPPVATWVLQQFMEQHRVATTPGNHLLGNQLVANGGTLDLQPQKKEVEDVLRGTNNLGVFKDSRRLPCVSTDQPMPKPRMTLAEFRKRVEGGIPPGANPKAEASHVRPSETSVKSGSAPALIDEGRPETPSSVPAANPEPPIQEARPAGLSSPWGNWKC
jgi:site-specific DNA-cytosine methylase